MNIKKLIVILLVIQAIVGSYFEFDNFYFPYWIKNLIIPDVFEFSQTLTRIFRILAHVLTIIGAIKLINQKRIALINIFKFPMYFFMATNIFWFITTLFSTKYSFFTLPDETPTYFYIFKMISFSLLILIFINYWNSGKDIEQDIHCVDVSKSSRFFNWILDLSIILSFAFYNMQTLSQGFIFEDVAFLGLIPNWFILIYLLGYYFVLELLFLQTIGKLHNNAVVEYSGSKVKSILIRTICRLIPFEAFSFFGNKGWHDSISKTKVVIATK